MCPRTVAGSRSRENWIRTVVDVATSLSSIVGALKIASGVSLPGYGFLLFTRDQERWQIHVMTQDGVQEALCTLANRHLDCH